MADTVKVQYFQMLGGEPDPKRDKLLGEDSSVQTGKHEVDLEFSPGIYSIYTIGIDRAGNVSKASQPVRIEIADGKDENPVKVPEGLEENVPTKGK